MMEPVPASASVRPAHNTHIVYVGERGWALTTNDRRSLLDQVVVLQRGYHKEREIDPPSQVALQDRVTNVPTPYRQPLTTAFFELARAHKSPARIAGEYSSARFHLIVKINLASQSCE